MKQKEEKGLCSQITLLLPCERKQEALSGLHWNIKSWTRLQKKGSGEVHCFPLSHFPSSTNIDGPRSISYSLMMHSYIIWLKELACAMWKLVNCLWKIWCRWFKSTEGWSERQGHEPTTGHKDGSNICMLLLPMISTNRVVSHKPKVGWHCRQLR